MAVLPPSPQGNYRGEGEGINHRILRSGLFFS